MSSQSNDIKKLFSHLGLNPRDYLEIRPKPVSNATQARSSVSLPDGLLPIRPKAPTIPPPFAPVAPVNPAASSSAKAASNRPKIAPMLEDEFLPKAGSSSASLPANLLEEPDTVPKSNPDDLLRTVTLHSPPHLGSSDAQTLHNLFEQVKEPVHAGAPAEDEELEREQGLKEVIAETRYVPPAITARRPAPAEVHANQALDEALARLKIVPSGLQSTPSLTQDYGSQGAGSPLQKAFRRISKGGNA